MAKVNAKFMPARKTARIRRTVEQIFGATASKPKKGKKGSSFDSIRVDGVEVKFSLVGDYIFVYPQCTGKIPPHWGEGRKLV